MRAISWWYTLLLLTIDDQRRISQFPRELSTLAKNSWQWIQLQQKHTNSGRWWQGHPISCKISCCAVTKPSAEAYDFLATPQRSPSTIDGELQAFSHLPFFQTTTDITNRSNMNTQTRIWWQRPPTSAVNLATASSPTPSQEKVASWPQIRALERTSSYAECSWLIPLCVTMLQSKRSWRKAANTKSLN